jgi:homoserine trans-succinylase
MDGIKKNHELNVELNIVYRYLLKFGIPKMDAEDAVQEALKGIKENTQATNGKVRLNGAVVTGTPVELKRFQELDFIRASVLGATIDKY